MKKHIHIPVFGPQELFNGVPDYVEFIRFNDYSRDYLWGDSNSINHLGFRDLKAIPIVAMRRIEEIENQPTVNPEPKSWTVEDQKAGRLPEVGVEFQTSTGKRKCVITEGKFIFTVNDDVVEVYTIESAMPVETPEDKFVRSFVEINKQTVKAEISESTVRELYRAIRDGKLSVTPIVYR